MLVEAMGQTLQTSHKHELAISRKLCSGDIKLTLFPNFLEELRVIDCAYDL